jgi:hypothetical protein
MAELTEVFPTGKQFDGLMHMYVYVITFDLPTFVILCIIISLFFFIFHQIFHGLFYWLMEIRPTMMNEHDIEQAYDDDDDDDHDHHHERVTIFHTLLFTNLQAWTMVATIEEDDYDERRGQKLRACKRLPPLMKYDDDDDDEIVMHEHELRRSCNGCVICLEDFQKGQLCQVFPVCKHIFHSDCIDHWLQKKLTCPICRRCI